MTYAKLLPSNELDAFEQAMRSYGSRAIRVRADRTDCPLPFSTTIVPWYSLGRFLEDGEVRPAAHLNYAVADYYIQDAASLLPLALLDIQPDDLVCDLCAAPGGKASAIGELLGTNGFLLANESIHSRLDVLKYSMARTGKPNYALSCQDPDDLVRFCSQMFDVVVVDAPCSGQTLVGRSKRDENAFAETQIEHCALRQRRILQAAISILKPGGRLIYSTCTFAVEENEMQVEWLLNEFPDAWEPIQPTELAAWNSPIQPGCYRLWPHRDRCAGGFAAGLKLTRELDLPLESTGKLKKKVERKVTAKNEKLEKEKHNRGSELLGELGAIRDVEVQWKEGQAYGMTPGVASLMKQLRHIGHPPMLMLESGNHFVPTQALAMLIDSYFKAHKLVTLNQTQSISYMAGNTIAHDGQGVESGWSLACWNKKPLGWLKSAGNRWNNHLPSWARLQIDS